MPETCGWPPTFPSASAPSYLSLIGFPASEWCVQKATGPLANHSIGRPADWVDLQSLVLFESVTFWLASWLSGTALVVGTHHLAIGEHHSNGRTFEESQQAMRRGWVCPNTSLRYTPGGLAVKKKSPSSSSLLVQ